MTCWHCLVALSLFAPVSAAAGWQTSNLQLLHGGDFFLGSPDRTILTVEHARGGDLGDLFVFIDATDRNDIGREYYGEVYGQVGLSGLTGRDWRFGPVKDVSLSLGLNAGSEPSGDPFRAWLAGISLDFDVPAFQLLQVDIHAYHEESAPHTGVQITPAWDARFNVGSQEFRFRGFADWISGRASAGGKP